MIKCLPEIGRMASERKGRCRQACALCQDTLRSHHAHQQKLNPELQLLLQRFASIESTSCICKACKSNLRRGAKIMNAGNQYIPRWLKMKTRCSIPSCCNDAGYFNHQYQWDTICRCVGIASISQDSPTLNPLCVAHYQLVYRMSNPQVGDTVACKVCNMKQVRRHHSESDSAHFLLCPEPARIEVYLRDAVGFSGSLSETDRVCPACFKYCKRLLRSGSSVLCSESVVRKKQTDIDSQLLGYVSTDHDSIIELDLLRTASYLCSELSNDHAVLFPQLYRKCCSYLLEVTDENICISRGRVLSYLGNQFGDLLSSVCHNRKTGTIFYRTKADPFVCYQMP